MLELDNNDIDQHHQSVLDGAGCHAKAQGAGNVMIGVIPTRVGGAGEFERQRVRALATIAATEVANVNPLAGRLQVDQPEPRLGGCRHVLFGRAAASHGRRGARVARWRAWAAN